MKQIIALSSMILSSVFFVMPTYAGTSGFYAGGGLGISRLDTNNRALFSENGWGSVENSFKREGLGWRLFVGYNLNEFLGAELGYTAYARSKYSGVTHHRLTVSRSNSLRAFSLVGKGSLPVADTGFNVYALGGGAQVNSHIEFNGYSETNNKIRPVYGAGIGYAFSEHVSTNLEVSRIKGEKGHLNAIPNADALTVNLIYNF